jgi:hypothetical protein
MRTRHASGVREGELLQHAKRLRERVDPLIPTLTPECATDRFDRLRTDLEAVRDVRDDEKALDRAGRWADPMVRAYADLLKYALDPKPPEVVVVPYPGGDIAFAALGRAPKEAQIAVQQFDDPSRLLVGYLDWARRGFHFFATEDRLYCTGRSPSPPKEFVRARLADLPYRVQPTGTEGHHACPHLASREPVPAITVRWPDAGLEVSVCRRCTKGDRQLLATLSQGIGAPHPERMFPVSVALNVDCRGGPGCVHRSLPELNRASETRYLYGRLSDAELIDAYRKDVEPRIENARAPLFVAAGVCYGSDQEAFTEALHPTPEERRALDAALPEVPGYFSVDQATASQALERLWPDHAETIVSAIVPDPERAQRLVNEARKAPGRVSDLLNRAAREMREREVLEALPRFDGLSHEAAFVDRIARAYRGQGNRAAERVLVQTLPGEGKERGLAFGILRALHQDQPHRWQFTDTEQQFGTALEGHAARVLSVPAPEYEHALGDLLAAAGVADWRARA